MELGGGSERVGEEGNGYDRNSLQVWHSREINKTSFLKHCLCKSVILFDDLCWWIKIKFLRNVCYAVALGEMLLISLKCRACNACREGALALQDQPDERFADNWGAWAHVF